MPQNNDTYLELVLSGGSFATELAGATNATFNTSSISKLGAGYQMMGIGGNAPDDNSDVMMIYDVKEVPKAEDYIPDVYEDGDILDVMMELCGIWVFGLGFFCKMENAN